MRECQFAAGEAIFWEGDRSDLAYLIKSGQVEILKNGSDGPFRLAVLGEGDVFGEMGLIDDRPRSAGARALQPVFATAVDRNEFIRLLLYRPREIVGVLRTLFERLRMMNELLAEQRTVKPRPSLVGQVRLLALTPETEVSIPAGGLVVARFPFRVGGKPESEDAGLLACNELEVHDAGNKFLSINHFSIDLGGDGAIVRDRGSRTGTVVNQVRIGCGTERDVAPLNAGDNEVVAGPPDSPFRFKVVVESA